MSMVFDEFGRPFIIVRDQEKQERIKGIEAIKVRYLLILCSNSKLYSPIYWQHEQFLTYCELH